MERVFHGIPTNVYVDVEVMSDKNGNTLPLSIIWRREVKRSAMNARSKGKEENYICRMENGL